WVDGLQSWYNDLSIAGVPLGFKLVYEEVDRRLTQAEADDEAGKQNSQAQQFRDSILMIQERGGWTAPDGTQFAGDRAIFEFVIGTMSPAVRFYSELSGDPGLVPSMVAGGVGGSLVRYGGARLANPLIRGAVQGTG